MYIESALVIFQVFLLLTKAIRFLIKLCNSKR